MYYIVMKKHRLSDAYQLPGIIPAHEVQVTDPDNGARVIVTKRRQKKRFVLSAVKHIMRIMTKQNAVFGICRVASCEYIWRSRYDGLSVRSVT